MRRCEKSLEEASPLSKVSKKFVQLSFSQFDRQDGKSMRITETQLALLN